MDDNNRASSLREPGSRPSDRAACGVSPVPASIPDAAAFFNGIVNDFAAAQARVSEAVTPREYRGWSISWDYGEYSATGPNYDASWEGPEDGWVDNGHRVFASTLDELRAEVDALIEDRRP